MCPYLVFRSARCCRAASPACGNRTVPAAHAPFAKHHTHRTYTPNRHIASPAYALRSPEHALAERRNAAVARDARDQEHVDVLANTRAKLIRARVRHHQMRHMQARTLIVGIRYAARAAHGHHTVRAGSTCSNDAGCAGDIAYQLARSRVTIQRLRDRIAAIKLAAEQRSRAMPGLGYVLREAVDDHRVTFVFHALPDKSVRDLMTRHGFVFDARRSSDGESMWGRKCTPTAIMTAQRLLPELNALMTVSSSVANPARSVARQCRPALTGDVATLNEVAA